MTENEPVTTTIAETENYLAWKAEEPDGETTYHLELNNVTLHFFKEEWQEFLKLTEIIVDEELYAGGEADGRPRALCVQSSCRL